MEVSSSESQAVCRKVLAALLTQMLTARLSKEPDALAVRQVSLAQAQISAQGRVGVQVKIVREEGSVHATFPDKNDLGGLDAVAVHRDWL